MLKEGAYRDYRENQQRYPLVELADSLAFCLASSESGLAGKWMVGAGIVILSTALAGAGIIFSSTVAKSCPMS